MEFECLTCKKTFVSTKHDKRRTPKYCTRKCYSSRQIPDSTRKKQSEARKGKVPWNKGVKMWEGKEHPRGTLGKKNLRKNYIVSQETKKKLSKKYTGKKRPDLSGKNHWNWKGGKNEKVRKSLDYKIWRKAVFERDEYTCQICGKKGGSLHADHIEPFAFCIDKRLDLKNGRTLCVACHVKTPTYGLNAYKYKKNNLPATVKLNGEAISWGNDAS